MSFEKAHAEDLNPHVVIYNPEVLSFACVTQVNRFGLTGDRRAPMAGRLKGTRHSLTEMLRTYGNNIEFVRAAAQDNRIG
jgi:hypothetical protein